MTIEYELQDECLECGEYIEHCRCKKWTNNKRNVKRKFIKCKKQ